MLFNVAKIIKIILFISIKNIKIEILIYQLNIILELFHSFGMSYKNQNWIILHIRAFSYNCKNNFDKIFRTIVIQTIYLSGGELLEI